MKNLKSTLLALILILISTAFCWAQAKQKSAKPTPTLALKPTFESTLLQADVSPFSISGGFTIQQTNDFLIFETAGADNLSHSKQISADDFTRMKENHDLVRDSLTKKLGHAFNLYMQARRNKFMSDTSAAYHPKK